MSNPVQQFNPDLIIILNRLIILIYSASKFETSKHYLQAHLVDAIVFIFQQFARMEIQEAAAFSDFANATIVNIETEELA